MLYQLCVSLERDCRLLRAHKDKNTKTGEEESIDGGLTKEKERSVWGTAPTPTYQFKATTANRSGRDKEGKRDGDKKRSEKGERGGESGGHQVTK